MAVARIRLAAHLLLLLSNPKSWTKATSETLPRLIITSPENTEKIHLPPNNEPVYFLAGEDQKHVVTVGDEDFIFTWQHPDEKDKRKVPWESCRSQPVCNVRITLVQKTSDSNHILLCGKDERPPECCYMNLSRESPACNSSKMYDINQSITSLQIKREDPSVLVESGTSADLYIAHSRDKDLMGLYRFGKNRLDPSDNADVHQYVSLIYSRRESDPLQDRVYAFYKEKNKSTDPYSERWTPYVAQVCASDKGGSKKKLQFKWTSLLRARLFCGKAHDKVYFSELVDVATVEAPLWNDTKVYALFRNEWGMSAVCVYTVGDMHNIFMTSRFTGDKSSRSRQCVADSTSLRLQTLDDIQQTSEMEQWVKPLQEPLLISKHHNYTHLVIDSLITDDQSPHPLLFLSLNNGGIHKVVHNDSRFLVMAEYRPFQHRRHITGLTLDSLTRKLYVATRDELVQVDVGNCSNNGQTCEDCVLSRDPYCGWDGSACRPYKSGMKRDVSQGGVDVCRSTDIKTPAPLAKDVRVAADSPCFLRCPVTSHHAQYSWHHGGASSACSMKEQQCLLLIDAAGAKRGRYECLAQESGHNWTVALYQLEVLSRSAGFSLGPGPRLPLVAFIAWTLVMWRVLG